MTSKIGILYGRPSRTTEGTWSEEPEGGVYEKETPEYIASVRKRNPDYPDVYYNQNKYEGEIEDGKPHGDGTWTMGNSAVYVGQWVNGCREGLGTFTWSKFGPGSGKSYEGEHKDDRRHGKGKMIYAPDPKTGFEGSVDEGNWIDNKQVLEDDWWKEGGKDYTEEELQKRVKYHEEKTGKGKMTSVRGKD